MERVGQVRSWHDLNDVVPGIASMSACIYVDRLGDLRLLVQNEDTKDFFDVALKHQDEFRRAIAAAHDKDTKVRLRADAMAKLSPSERWALGITTCE